ncbi:MAG: hypothetical protein E6199_17550, partial [Mixta calida]|nr:hypothetical protein [Mixta calida]
GADQRGADAAIEGAAAAQRGGTVSVKPQRQGRKAVCLWLAKNLAWRQFSLTEGVLNCDYVRCTGTLLQKSNSVCYIISH